MYAFLALTLQNLLTLLGTSVVAKFYIVIINIIKINQEHKWEIRDQMRKCLISQIGAEVTNSIQNGPLNYRCSGHSTQIRCQNVGNKGSFKMTYVNLK